RDRRLQESCRAVASPAHGIAVARRAPRGGVFIMRSKAAIHGHPVHPILVTIPIGAFVSAALGDVLFSLRGQPQWFEFSRLAISVGLLAAPLAAIAGLIDYFGLGLRGSTARTATFHLGFNVIALL